MMPPPYRDANFIAWQPGRRMATHRHDFLQSIHVLEGTLEVTTGGRRHLIGPGQVHVLPPGHDHALASPDGQRQFGINFRVERDERGLLHRLLERFPEPTVLAMAMEPAAIADLHRAQSDPLAFAQALDAYCLRMARCGESAADPGRRLLDLLETHARGPIGVELVAAEFGCSRATLQRLCHQHHGCGVAALHEGLRLDLAARLLIGEPGSIAACGEAVGYADGFAFSRAFKRRYGIPPSRYRERQETALA